METTRITGYYLQMRYGPAVEVQHIDLADPEARAEYADLVAIAEDRNLPYPLVAIGGQVKLAGTAHYFSVLPLVDEALRAEAVP